MMVHLFLHSTFQIIYMKTIYSYLIFEPQPNCQFWIRKQISCLLWANAYYVLVLVRFMDNHSFFYFSSSSSLFTVNSSHAFVHVQPCSRAFDPVSVLLNTLAKPAINTKWGKELHKTSISLYIYLFIFMFWKFTNRLFILRFPKVRMNSKKIL